MRVTAMTQILYTVFSPMNLDLDKIRRDTPGISHSVHLMAAGSVLMPQCVVDAVINHTLLEAQLGGYEAHAQQAKQLDNVYNLVAGHIAADPREIALVENATVAWCHAFYALPLRPGTRILTCEAEYAANYVAFLQRAKRDDLTIDVIPNDHTGALDLTALESMIDDKVGLIAITWIPTNGGLVNPAGEVGKIACRHNIPYLLDACQALGQMPVNVEDLGCDFLSATGRKFLRGPRGTGFLYVASKWLQSLEPAMIDHFAAPWIKRDQYQLRDDARRFETWENAYALRAGLGAAIAYADQLGIENIQQRSWQLAATCREMLQQIPGCMIRDTGARQCAIVSFTIENLDPRKAVSALRQKGIAIGASNPSSTRLDSEARNLPEMMRVAPHYYNSEDELEFFTSALRSLV